MVAYRSTAIITVVRSSARAFIIIRPSATLMLLGAWCSFLRRKKRCGQPRPTMERTARYTPNWVCTTIKALANTTLRPCCFTIKASIIRPICSIWCLMPTKVWWVGSPTNMLRVIWPSSIWATTAQKTSPREGALVSSPQCRRVG